MFHDVGFSLRSLSVEVRAERGWVIASIVRGGVNVLGLGHTPEFAVGVRSVDSGGCCGGTKSDSEVKRFIGSVIP